MSADGRDPPSGLRGHVPVVAPSSDDRVGHHPGDGGAPGGVARAASGRAPGARRASRAAPPAWPWTLRVPESSSQPGSPPPRTRSPAARSPHATPSSRAEPAAAPDDATTSKPSRSAHPWTCTWGVPRAATIPDASRANTESGRCETSAGKSPWRRADAGAPARRCAPACSSSAPSSRASDAEPDPLGPQVGVRVRNLDDDLRCPVPDDGGQHDGAPRAGVERVGGQQRPPVHTAGREPDGGRRHVELRPGTRRAGGQYRRDERSTAAPRRVSAGGTDRRRAGPW